MKTVKTISDLCTLREVFRGEVGLVPTMGFLHEGHLSLIRLAKSENRHVVVTIFVNPTQFCPQEDFACYPRDLDRDLSFLESEQVDLVWIPPVEEMYPPDYQTWVTVEHLTRHLEGSLRPHHFRGVTTIVSKLFIAVRPSRAYFGQKDAQQVIVIKKMVKDLNFPLEIIIGETIREQDGLAMSSRNKYLTTDHRAVAPILFHSLQKAFNVFNQGERNSKNLIQVVENILKSEPLVNIQYISCANMDTLEEIEGEVTSGLLSLAVQIGQTRLIDNIILG